MTMGHLKINNKFRARSMQDKHEKRHHIIVTALNVFKTHDYQKITMNLIAQKSKIAKGTLYIYFQTKEELFLNILLFDLNN